MQAILYLRNINIDRDKHAKFFAIDKLNGLKGLSKSGIPFLHGDWMVTRNYAYRPFK